MVFILIVNYEKVIRKKILLMQHDSLNTVDNPYLSLRRLP